MASGPFRITWRQFAEIVGLCTVAGVIVGVLVYFAGFWPRLPWRALPLIFVVACVVALAFAVVAAVFASIVLIFIAEHGLLRRQSASHIAAYGALVGALVGTLHPFALAWLVVMGLRADGAIAFSGLQMATVAITAGALAGSLIVLRYGPRMLAAV
jgi:hypothetical protein